MYSKHKSGAIAELKAAQYFIEHDYEIFFPMSMHSIIDFIALKDNNAIRVQVKSAYYMKRSTGASYIQVTTRRNSSIYGHQCYKKDDYDLLVVLYENRLWIFPCEDVYNFQSIVLDKGQQTRRAGKNNFDASQYEINLTNAVDMV